MAPYQRFTFAMFETASHINPPDLSSDAVTWESYVHSRSSKWVHIWIASCDHSPTLYYWWTSFKCKCKIDFYDIMGSLLIFAPYCTVCTMHVTISSLNCNTHHDQNWRLMHPLAIVCFQNVHMVQQKCEFTSQIQELLVGWQLRNSDMCKSVISSSSSKL